MFPNPARGCLRGSPTQSQFVAVSRSVFLSNAGPGLILFRKGGSFERLTFKWGFSLCFSFPVFVHLHFLGFWGLYFFLSCFEGFSFRYFLPAYNTYISTLSAAKFILECFEHGEKDDRYIGRQKAQGM